MYFVNKHLLGLYMRWSHHDTHNYYKLNWMLPKSFTAFNATCIVHISKYLQFQIGDFMEMNQMLFLSNFTLCCFYHFTSQIFPLKSVLNLIVDMTDMTFCFNIS